MPTSPDARTRRTERLLLVIVVIWAANYPVAKYGLEGLNELVFNSIRFIVAAAVIAIPLARREHWTPVERADIPKLLQAGIIASVIYQVAFIVGLSMTTAGTAAILLSTSPLWTVLISARLHRERIERMMMLGMIVSLCGVILIIIGSGVKLEFGGRELAGDLIALAAASLWGLNTALQKPLLVRYSAVQLAFILVAVGAVGLTLIAVPAGIGLAWGSVHWSYYLAAVASGALSIGIGNAVWSRGVKHLGPGRTAAFNNLVPALAFVFSFLTLREKLLPIQFVGAAVTIAGVWLARR